MADDTTPKPANGDAPAKPSRPGMLGDGTEEQNLDQTGDPNARITEADVAEAFDPDSSKPGETAPRK